ncbi:hypothetical protein IQ244_29550 [Nostoc sp. LEGE 06077]|uniref:HNH endonuclease n=1 Tax=Nostoc sp. LEGE 06077 TaxID=915325 RepID=UPI0018819691|nr:HNH endonuclease [Nostoc sp. LEGE 06077]MBE9210575.1 hypothetical protein [Nostoc sp. LEGE 06077]
MFTRFEKLSKRASELKNCFYCGTSLPATAKEHIFNSSWGGSHKTGNLICNECNSSFSTQTDIAFAVYVQAVMNSWSFKGERHKEVPKIILENGYFLDQGAKLKFKQPFVKDKVLPDGSINSTLIFNSKSQAKRWIEGQGMVTWLGRDPLTAEKENLQKIIRETKPDITDAKPQPMSVQLNLREQYRSSAHTILKCLGFFLPEWVCNDFTKPVREFARYDKGNWLSFAVEVEQLFSPSEQVISMFGLGVYHNSVEVYWSSSAKMVVGVLNILNRIQRSVVISENYSGADAILYVGETTNGSKKPPEAVYIEFAPNQLSVPLLGIQHFSVSNTTYKYFQDEFAKLMSISYPIDAITASLIQKIEATNNKNLKLNKITLEEYLNLFLGFFLELDKVAGCSVDLNKVRSTLLKYGFTTLANQHINKLSTEADVQSLITSAFELTMKDFQAGMLNAD